MLLQLPDSEKMILLDLSFFWQIDNWSLFSTTFGTYILNLSSFKINLDVQLCVWLLKFEEQIITIYEKKIVTLAICGWSRGKNGTTKVHAKKKKKGWTSTICGWSWRVYENTKLQSSDLLMLFTDV